MDEGGRKGEWMLVEGWFGGSINRPNVSKGVGWGLGREGWLVEGES